jgi:hypothetical protein
MKAPVMSEDKILGLNKLKPSPNASTSSWGVKFTDKDSAFPIESRKAKKWLQSKFQQLCIQSVLSKVLYEYLLRFEYKNKKFKNRLTGFFYELN